MRRGLCGPPRRIAWFPVPELMRPKHVNLIQLNVAVLMWGGTAMFAKGIALPVTDIICRQRTIDSQTCKTERKSNQQDQFTESD